MTDDLYNNLLKAGLKHDEINQFIKAYEKGIYFPRYVRDLKVLRKMREICAKHNYKFNNLQQEVILNALINGVDPTYFANPEYNHNIMKQIYCGLLNNVNITEYPDALESYNLASEVRLAMQNGLSKDLIKYFIEKCKKSSYYFEPSYLRYCLEDGVPITELNALKQFDDTSLRKLRAKYKKH